MRQIKKCTHCNPNDSDCQWCGKQGYIGSCDNAQCQEFGHGDSRCTMFVTDDEINKINNKD